jgi:hypothetical protein
MLLEFLADGNCVVNAICDKDKWREKPMATLSELVKAIAQIEGIEPATVSLIARNVREAGLISTRGRGLSAAKMSLADAANLLIAVNATVTAREAPDTVRKYRRLELRRRETQLGKLGEALEQLIDAALSKRLPQKLLSCYIPVLLSQEFGKEQARVELVFHKPLPYAYLSISALDEARGVDGSLLSDDTDDASFVGSLRENASLMYFEFKLPSDPLKRHARKYGDRKDTTSIGYATMRAIAELLRE